MVFREEGQVTDGQTTTRIALDWSRLLGFDQAVPAGAPATAAGLNDPRLAKLGAKFGNKGGTKTP